LVLVAGVWFVALQFFVLKAFCPFCLTAHACGSIMALLTLARSQVPLREHFLPPGSVRGTWLAALGGLGLLIGGQLAYVPSTFTVQASAGASAVQNSVGLTRGSSTVSAGSRSAVQSGKLRSPSRPDSPSRLLSLHGGLFEIDLHEVPILGSPDAEHVMVSLFDYTCRQCRDVHKHLVEAQHHFSNQLAIVSLPMPLDRQCNPLIETTLPDHTNACVYARLGLAVWLADRGKLAAFDDWMFSAPPTLSTMQATEHAANLVGTNALATALQNTWINRQLELDNRLCASNYYWFGYASLPQLIIGTNIISGTFGAADLDRFLASQFGLTGRTNAP
jgi:hypothetical protein